MLMFGIMIKLIRKLSSHTIICSLESMVFFFRTRASILRPAVYGSLARSRQCSAEDLHTSMSGFRVTYRATDNNGSPDWLFQFGWMAGRLLGCWQTVSGRPSERQHILTFDTLTSFRRHPLPAHIVLVFCMMWQSRSGGLHCN